MRVYLKLSQAEFAEKLGITREHLSRIETGKLKASTRVEFEYGRNFGNRSLVLAGVPDGEISCPICHSTRDVSLLHKDYGRALYSCAACRRKFAITRPVEREDYK